MSAAEQECVHIGYCPYKEKAVAALSPQLARSTLAIVLAGGRGSRLGPLTDWRAKPAVPFGGKFRIIDFTLSNCVNSGIRRIGIATQYKAQSLIRHVQRGWSFLDGRFDEFVELLPAQQRVTADWYLGTADTVYQNLDILRESKPTYVLVLAPDYYFTYDNAEVQDLYAQAVASTSESQAATLLETAARIVSEDAAADWLYNGASVLAVGTNVAGMPSVNVNERLNLAELTKSDG